VSISPSPPVFQHPSSKPLASFGRRRGRKLRGARQEALQDTLPLLQLKLEEVSALPRPLCIEIGFGGGEHLLAQAQANPDVHFIGCEPYMDGVANLLKTAAPKNLRIFPDDARLLLPHLPPASVDAVFILFPDPWPKARHHKRRLIQPALLAELARVMVPGGRLLLATDHADYLSWMLMHVLACKDFTWTAKTATDWSQPPAGWVRTRYQEKAEKEGRPATWLELRRT